MRLTTYASAQRTVDPTAVQYSTARIRAVDVVVDVTDISTPRLTVATTTQGATAVSEVQTITGGGTIEGGTWTITVGAETTGAIAYNANATTVQAALEALTGVGVGDIVVSGGALGTAAFVLTWAATGNQAAVTVDDSSLTTDNAPEITVAVSGVDTLSGARFALLTGVPVSTVSTAVMELGPELTAGNDVANTYLPDIIEITVVHTNSDPITYSVGIDLIS